MWQAAQEMLLKTGPRPPAIVSTDVEILLAGDELGLQRCREPGERITEGGAVAGPQRKHDEHEVRPPRRGRRKSVCALSSFSESHS